MICKYVITNKITNMHNFHALEVVGRGTETQPQVVDNLNKLTTLKTF